MDLKQHIREIIEQELNELARISTLHKIGDAKKAAALKKLHAGTWIEDMINAVEKGGETGITRNDIVVATGKGHTAAVSPMIRKLLDAGVFVLGSLAKAKKEKTLHIDVANPYEFRQGLQHELEQGDEYTDEALEKFSFFKDKFFDIFN